MDQVEYALLYNYVETFISFPYPTLRTHLVVTVQSESNELSEEAALQSILPEIAWPASALMTLGTITEYPPGNKNIV